MDCPAGNQQLGIPPVSENLLPFIKARFHLISRFLPPEYFESVIEKVRPLHIDADQESYTKYIFKLKEEAKARPDVKIGFIHLNACHGFNV